VANGLLAGRPLSIAIDAAIDRWMGWNTNRRIEREIGIPRGLPHLTGWVTHFEITGRSGGVTAERRVVMEDWSGLTPAEIRARVAAAREPALRKFLANYGATLLPGETLEQAVRRVQLDIAGAIRRAAETALPNETFEQSMNRVLSRTN